MPICSNYWEFRCVSPGFLPLALDCLKHWGFTYSCTFDWHKPGGFQPVGMPQFNCEFAIYAHKGSPRFVDTKNLPTRFSAPRNQG
jgi:hypothetical protein